MPHKDKAERDAWNAAYRATHKAEEKARGAAWYRVNADRVKARGSAWRLLNLDRVRVVEQRRRDALRPVVYGWFAPDGRADWVGRGSSARPMVHKWRARWWTPEHLLLSMTLDSEWEAMEYEGKWGQRYLPTQNKEGYRHAS